MKLLQINKNTLQNKVIFKNKKKITIMQGKSRRKFIVTPQAIQFQSSTMGHKFIVKNTSLRVESFEVINPNQDHYKIESGRKFTLAPGMSNMCSVSHIICEKCNKYQFNKLRVASSQKQSILIQLQCPRTSSQQQKLIQCVNLIDFGEFNVELQKIINIPIKNLTGNNLKLTVSFSSDQAQAFNLELEQTQIILLKQRQTVLKGNLSFISGCQFNINLIIKITSQENLSGPMKIQKIVITGNALVRNQVVKGSNGKALEVANLKVLNGTTATGEFFIVNNFRKDCYFKITPEINSSNPNEFSQKWTASQIKFSQPLGQIKAFESKKITYEIKTTPNVDDINFTQKFSKIDYHDEINISKMMASKFFRKNVEINVKTTFIEKKDNKEQNSTNFKIKLNIINPALKIKNKKYEGKEVFQIYNQTELNIPYEIENNTLYKAFPQKGVFKHEKELIQIEWKKSARPFSGTKTDMMRTTFSLAYGKCNIFLKLPSHNLQIYNFIQRENLRPNSSTIKQNLGLQKSQSMMLKRPLSAICNEMVAKKLHLVEQKDFYKEIPRFLPIQKLKNDELQKLVISSSEKGNIISNTWNKQIAAFFSGKGYLILKPLKTYLLPYTLELSTLSINEQQFQLEHRYSSAQSSIMIPKNISLSQSSYTLSSKELNFTFNPSRKQYYVQNYLGITNISRQAIKAFLLTVQDEYFVSGEDGNKVIVQPNETVNFRLRLFPTTPYRKQTKITRTLQFLINGNKQQITCNGQLLTVDEEHSPNQLYFTDCHFGQLETEKKITLTNCGFNKFCYEVQCPRYVSVSYTQSSGAVAGKENVVIGVRFRPTVYLENYKDCIKILIRGSHTIIIPLLITTKNPNITILQKQIDFGQGILGDTVQGSIQIENRNNNSIECRISLNQTELSLQDDNKNSIISLQSNQRKLVNFYTKIKSIGIVNNNISKSIASISGYGAIQSPIGFSYIGKQNIMQITPVGTNHVINVEQTQCSYVMKFTSLIGHKIQLKAELVSEQKFDSTFIMSLQPQMIEILPYSQKELLVNCLIADLQKLKEIERNYMLRIFRKGVTKPYTILRIKVKLPTPKLIITPNQLYFPITGLNQWGHRNFKIQNKGYKQIHFKIKKPVNIAFQLQCVVKFYSNITTNSTENKLTKLNNQAQIRVSFKSKSVISFQNIIEIEDNFGNIYTVRFFGMTTNSPLLLSGDNGAGSMPLSSKSIQSIGSVGVVRTGTTISVSSNRDIENLQNEVDNAKFLNFWIGSLMPHMKKQSSFNQYLSRPQTLIQFLSYFSIQLPKITQKQRQLSQILFQLRRIDIPLDVINSDQLSRHSLSQWVKFIYIFLSKRLLHPECLKWVSKTAGQTVDSYELAYSSHKKILINLLNSIFYKVFKMKILQYDKLVSRFDPSLQFLFKIETRKHLIIALNLLYYKFNNSQSQFIKSQQLNHRLSIAHNHRYQRTINCLISNSSPQIVFNTNGVNSHTNISSCGYYFSLDKMHPQTELTLALKESCCICMINSTLFQKCHFVEYQLLEIQPKVHSVTIECQDKFTQEWGLDYNAPVDSQYKIQFTGSPEFKCKWNALGLIKVGKKIPISITYSPTNLNLHQAILTIMNKHYKEIYNIKGKPLFSRNVEYERHIKVCQGKKHSEVIQIPWEYSQQQQPIEKKDKLQQSKKDSKPPQPELPKLTLTQYNEKRKEFISHKLTVMKQGKKDLIVRIKIQYQFNEIFKSLPLSYQIMNEDKTQSKIIRLFIKVIPKPINIEAQVRCKLEQSVTEKIPIQNLLDEKQIVIVQFFRSLQQVERYDKFQKKGSLEYTDRSNAYDFKPITSRNDNQFRLSRLGKMHLQSRHLQNITLTYRPDSLFETLCIVRLTYESNESVINYKFKGIPVFPSTLNQQIILRCKVEEKKTFKIQLKSLVRENTTFDVQTNIKQLSGKDKITLSSGQTLQYPVQFLSHHSGILTGQLIFKSPQVTLVYPLQITIQQNLQLIQKYEVDALVRQSMTLQLQLLNKSKEDITYSVYCDHEYLTCPDKFYIERNSKKNLEVVYLPYVKGQFKTKVKLYHPDLKEIIYELRMTAHDREEVIEGPAIELMDSYVFVLPIKNHTPRDCLIQKSNLPEGIRFKSQDYQFPLSLLSGKSIKIQLLYHPKKLVNRFEQMITFKTDCIGEYNYLCRLNILQTKTMGSIDILNKCDKSEEKVDSPFNVKFINEFNQRLEFHVEYKGSSQDKMFDSFTMKSAVDFAMQPFETTQIQGEIKINLQKISSQKSQSNITSIEQIPNPMQLILSTVKDKIRYEFIYPIKLISLYQNSQHLVIKSNAYEMKRTAVNLAVVRQVTKWKISGLSEDFIKNSFGFISPHHHQHYLQTVINKPLKYDGFITLFNERNQAERIPLKLQIGEPKYEPVVISSNVGQKTTVQIRLKNGQGPFKCDITNNKNQQFAVYPMQGVFVEEMGELVAKVNFIYFPKEYSGIKRAKVAITSEHGCYYFSLMGKFKSLKK